MKEKNQMAKIINAANPKYPAVLIHKQYDDICKECGQKTLPFGTMMIEQKSHQVHYCRLCDRDFVVMESTVEIVK